ncbi:predicted protein [Chaetomium globosum CBS 148.51]|uniref:Secreted protein n=1 Tax=Chaetomium globosum (strain ATCC 6205 / CBS 148.51 / DSM 1962 / NBRC 6347 / NRRL 1970) TaxID=306901 RepID=Q2HGW6_CHAGB|nr:uncharacterized protein CHGG_00538 [Chaetomium globosum CBS 148.51]EAQ92303.1 predicted protein [Chaetomium globosum CBS 148.51]
MVTRHLSSWWLLLCSEQLSRASDAGREWVQGRLARSLGPGGRVLCVQDRCNSLQCVLESADSIARAGDPMWAYARVPSRSEPNSKPIHGCISMGFLFQRGAGTGVQQNLHRGTGNDDTGLDVPWCYDGFRTPP